MIEMKSLANDVAVRIAREETWECCHFLHSTPEALVFGKLEYNLHLHRAYIEQNERLRDEINKQS